MTNLRFTLLLTLLLLALTGCGQPVPLHKSAYIGEWQSPEMYLLINPDGRVHYRKFRDGDKVSVKGRLQGFRGDDFQVGYGFFTTTFTVTTPPYLNDDDTWRMVVEGIELVRTRRLLRPGQGGIMV